LDFGQAGRWEHDIIAEAGRMTDATFAFDDVAPFDRGPLSERVSSRIIYGAIALAVILLAGARMLDVYCTTIPKAAEVPAASLAATVPAPAALARPIVAPKVDIALLDPAHSLGIAPASFAQSSPLGANFGAFASAPTAAIAQSDRVA